MMKRLAVFLLFLMMICTSGVAFAGLDDTRASMESQYGDYRMVIDTDNQMWTKSEWDQKGQFREKAAAYTYSFSRQKLGFELEASYNGKTPQSTVIAQRFTPNMSITVKEFKNYFPEIYSLIASPHAQAFASSRQVTRQFQELQSPVTMGILVKEAPATQKGYYTLLAFNIQDEGRLIKDPKFIDANTYIREFTIERVFQKTAVDSLESGEWQPIKNCF